MSIISGYNGSESEAKCYQYIRGYATTKDTQTLFPETLGPRSVLRGRDQNVSKIGDLPKVGEINWTAFDRLQYVGPGDGL